ncbi:hypothetical protein [Serinicoccus kebangsaanensis]|uniref:hypothetical protein n=1 Tax=Serinicoccus kebangsaanensis TaxID=2602069 RepID=UPI00124E340B|nr:hypothetical protein [Serinicoccus kebangsaanensis]
MLIRIDAGASMPVFEQIGDQWSPGVRGGDLVADEKLPPVRQLAAELGIAPLAWGLVGPCERSAVSCLRRW